MIKKVHCKIYLADIKKSCNFCIACNASFGKIKLLLNVLLQYNFVGNAVKKRRDRSSHSEVLC